MPRKACRVGPAASITLTPMGNTARRAQELSLAPIAQALIWQAGRALLCAPVIVGIARYIFFGEGITGLHFNNFQRLVASTGDSVSGASFDIDMLSVMIISNRVIQCHLCNAANHNPVFVPVCMALKTESLSGIYEQAFYFCFRAVFENEETSPGSVCAIATVCHLWSFVRDGGSRVLGDAMASPLRLMILTD